MGSAKHDVKESAQVDARAVITFILPSYKTPLLVSELLNTAQESGKYDRCDFVLLLDINDPTLKVYHTVVANLAKKGMVIGCVVYDGTPYAGMINRYAIMADSHSFCVIDAKHMPMCGEGTIADHVEKWLQSSMEPMRVAMFGDAKQYPVVTPVLTDRLGYMFHPLALGRKEAECWLMKLAQNLNVLSSIPDVMVIESKTDGAEIIGVSDKELQDWVEDTLDTYLDLEVDRLSDYILR